MPEPSQAQMAKIAKKVKESIRYRGKKYTIESSTHLKTQAKARVELIRKSGLRALLRVYDGYYVVYFNYDKK